MSGPLASNIAAQAGVAQTAAPPKQVRGKEGDSARSATIHGDDEEGREGRTGGGGKAGGAGGAANTAATFGSQDKQKVKRKKVKLGNVGTKDTAGKTKGTGGTGETQQQAKTDGTRRPGQGYSAEQSRALVNKAMGSQASLTQASVKFEQSQRTQQQADGNQGNPLSAAGQRRMMLENLSRAVKINLEQHTGGGAGEAYPRRETRQIFSALLGLKAGAAPKETGNTQVASNNRPVGKGEYSLKESKMNNVLAMFTEPPPPPEGHEPVELVA